MTDKRLPQKNENLRHSVRRVAQREGQVWRELQKDLESLLIFGTDRLWTPEGELLEILREMGAPCGLHGHHYAVRAVLMVVEDRNRLGNLSRMVYPQVAQRSCTTADRVERCIRTFVEAIWTRGDPRGREKYFGTLVDAERGKPTNSEFIGRLADAVRSRVWDGTAVYTRETAGGC